MLNKQEMIANVTRYVSVCRRLRANLNVSKYSIDVIKVDDAHVIYRYVDSLKLYKMSLAVL